MSGTWSERLEQRFSLQLPGDVRDWLNKGVWEEPGGAEFCRARTPEQLLDPEPGTIWAGFMMPDTLPIVGNDYGDWLCLRIAADGSLCELIHWSHIGGDWIPYGRNLAEALLYDAARHVLHPPQPHMAEGEHRSSQVFRSAQWASQWVTNGAKPLPPFWSSADSRNGVSNSIGTANSALALLDLLTKWDVAEFAVRRDRVLHFLQSPLKTEGGPALAEQIGVPWEPDFVRWVFDTELVPESKRAELQQSIDGDEQLFTQDWAVAEREALTVIRRRHDLGWAFDIAGWAAQRRCEWSAAINHYLAGLQTSWFSDDTVRFRTHWFEEGYGKFAASRLAELVDHLSDQQRRDPYLSIFLDNDPESLRTRVHQHWLAQAHLAEENGQFRQAYRYYYRAGWDLGLQPITAYDEIYAGLRRTASAAGTPALAAIAEMHHSFLVNGA